MENLSRIKVMVKSLVPGTVTYSNDMRHVRRIWQRQNQVIAIPADELQESIYDMGVYNLFHQGYLGIDNAEHRKLIGLDDESFDCNDCVFGDIICCKDAKKTWLESEYQPIVDWSKVKIDTPIYVTAILEDEWTPRYFAEYKDGKVYAWDDGKTSFTTTARVSWNYAKLAIKEELVIDE